jgi:septal ring factor EnvC (AmiA/AmiB activator)
VICFLNSFHLVLFMFEDELRLELLRKEKMLESLKKNYERRKKLNILEPSYERQISSDIRKLENEVSTIQRQLRNIESEQIRKRNISRN